MKIIQLDEKIGYPEGYSSVLVEGYDDGIEGFVLRRFPRVILEVPNSVNSDGTSRAYVKATIWEPDPNELIPSARAEHISASNPTTIGTRYRIKSITGVWYYLGETDEGFIKGDAIPYQRSEGNTITTTDEMIYQDVVVEYVGGNEAQFSVSAPDNDETVYASGEMSPEEVLVDGNVVESYFVPEAGEGGFAVISCRYKNVEASAIIQVDSGLLDNYSIKLAATPSSIDTGETSDIALELSDRNGSPIMGALVEFRVIQGPGSVSPATAVTDSGSETEGITSSSRTDISVGKPIKRVLSVAAAGYSYTGCTWQGRNILLNTPLPYEVMPVTVVYESGGIAHAAYSGPQDGTAYIIGLYKGRNGLCSVEVGTGNDPDSDNNPDGELNAIYGERVVAHITGYLDPKAGLITLSGGASLLSYGVSRDADGCTDDDPIMDQIEIYAHVAAFGLSVAGYSVGGADVKEGCSWPRLTLLMPWGYGLNMRETRVTVTEAANTEGKKDPIPNTRVIIGDMERTTDKDGKAVFHDLPPGTHNIWLENANYVINIEDEDDDNDTITIPPYSDKRFQLRGTSIDITIKARFLKGWTTVQ